MVQHFALVAMLSLIVCAYATISSSCTQPSDCSPGECCAIGMDRYSTASCRSIGKEGESCRPGDQPANYTKVINPKGDSVKITNAWTIICGCDPQDDLVCWRGVCTKSAQVPTD